jgi:transaldolase
VKRQRSTWGHPRLGLLKEAGVSIWLDDLSRDLLESGRLRTLTTNYGVTGVTSNPTIFASAIVGSSAYDDDLRAYPTHDPRELFLDLALEDVRRAADLLRSAYYDTGRRDGFASFECTPDLARDTAGTVEQALALWQRIDRPNAMIKVPATEEGIPAIEELTAAGVNVNVTLLFSVARYEQALDAYMRGLERRLGAGEPVDQLSSVASFFVSRVDAAIDRKLPETSPLRGRIGLANAASAYVVFSGWHRTKRWRSLEREGARPQRPLWASTSPKDPSYRDVLYVEGLIGPDVVNTMPEKTLLAFADHGDPTRTLADHDVSMAAIWPALAAHGISLERVTAQLERDGVRAFEDSYKRLLAAIEARTLTLAEHSPQERAA